MIFDGKLFLKLSLGFIIFTIIGTLLHECGHYFAAKSLGLDAEVHYGYTSSGNTTQKQWDNLSKKENIWFTLGGPLQTCLTGTLGFIFFALNRKKYINSKKLNLKDWILVFITFFWSREIVIFIFDVFLYLKNNKNYYRNDESFLNNDFNFYPLTIETILFVLAFTICSIVTFRFIPKKQRFTFIVSGFVGGIMGYILWLELLGKYILP